MNKKANRYFYSVIEESIQNPLYFGYRGGRIEVFDSQNVSGYAIMEYRFFLPEELYLGFREWIDFKETEYLLDLKLNTIFDWETK